MTTPGIDPKYTVVILITDRSGMYMASGLHVQPMEAVRIAYKDIATQMNIAVPAPRPVEKVTPTPAAPPQNPAAKGPQCPTHKTSKPSNKGGLFCPAKVSDATGNQAFCDWEFKDRQGAAA